jgi:DNA modification methylase
VIISTSPDSDEGATFDSQIILRSSGELTRLESPSTASFTPAAISSFSEDSWSFNERTADLPDEVPLEFTPVEQGLVTERYRTDLGRMYQAKVEHFLASPRAKLLEGKVNLIFTSPPFPLQAPKKYGNKTGDDYLNWLAELAPGLTKLLTADGSIVVELGNAWEKGHPVMSTLPLRALLKFQESGELFVNQQFICHNPARLPSPIEWVNKQRIRVKDTYTHVWWMSKTERPKADNRQVLVPYSASMKKLLRTKTYNSGARPSGHVIGETSFLADNGGAIPSNVLEYASDESESELEELLSERFPSNMLKFSNTSAGTPYREYCRKNGFTAHPAPMQLDLVRFFVKMLTSKGDLVYDPFGGSNTTGGVAEELGRRWVATEPLYDYIQGSVGRFSELRDNLVLPPMAD